MLSDGDALFVMSLRLSDGPNNQLPQRRGFDLARPVKGQASPPHPVLPKLLDELILAGAILHLADALASLPRRATRRTCISLPPESC